MNTNLFWRNLYSILLIAFSTTVFAQTSAFTYQGHLSDAAICTTSGAYDFQFALHAKGGALIDLSSAQTTGIRMINGVFTVQLDFGGNALAQEVKIL